MNSTIRYVAGGIASFISLISVNLALAQSFSAVTVDPEAIAANVPTTVVVRARLDSRDLFLDSVNVEMVDSHGRVIANLGSLNDAGIDHDDVAKDGIYSGAVTITESTPGAMSLRVSGYSLGSPGKSFSSRTAVLVVPEGVPTAPYATDLDHVVIDPDTGAELVSEEIIACYATNAAVHAIFASINTIEGQLVGRLPRDNCYQIQLPRAATASSVLRAVESIKRQPSVESAEPEYLDNPTATGCNFPTCTDTNSLSYSLLNLSLAHASSTGSGVIVGVIDSGLSITTDASLLGLALPGVNYTKANGGVATDTNDVPKFPHGTWVSGIIAASAPGASIVPYKVCVWSAAKNTNTCAVALETMAVQAATTRLVKVINLSLGGYTQNKALQKAIATAIASGIVVVAAAGNDSKDNGTTPFYPASYPNVVSVAGTNVASPVVSGTTPTVYTDTIWDAASCNSSTGVGTLGLNGSNFGSNVLIAAPSVCIKTNGYKAGKPNYCTGTSCAAPFVAGTAALVFQLHPTWTSAKVSQQLTNSAQPIYLLNSQDEIINQQIGPRLDSLAAVGAIRLSQDGDAMSTPINFGFNSSVNALKFGPFVALDGNTAPCEARANAATFAIALPCVFDSSLSPSLGAGTYLLTVQLGTGATADFFGTVNLTLPGLILSSANGTNATIQTPTQGTVSLDVTGLKIASFNVQYSPP